MEFIIGSKKEFLDFLNAINNRDRVGILTHNDLDGIASAIFLQKILENRGINLEFIDFLTYKKGMFDLAISKIKKKSVNKLFLADLAADSSDLEGFEKLRGEADSFLIDHHPIHHDLKDKKNIIKTNSTDCASITIYNLGINLFDSNEWGWLACAGIIADVSYHNQENLKFIQKIYPKVSKDNIWDSIPGEITKKITSALIYYNKNLKKVYDFILKKDLNAFNKVHQIVDDEIQIYSKRFKKEAEFFPGRDLYFYYVNPELNITSILSSIVSFEEPDKSFVLASDINKNFMKISARNQSGKEDMNLLMKRAIKNLENATGGGHSKAAAARIMKKDLGKFKENILRNY